MVGSGDDFRGGWPSGWARRTGNEDHQVQRRARALQVGQCGSWALQEQSFDAIFN